MRIAMTYPSSPFSDPGGGAKSFFQMAYHLEKLGVEVIILHPAKGNSFLLDNSSIVVNPVSMHHTHYFLNSFSFRESVIEMHRTQPFDAILCWDYEAALLLRFLNVQNIEFGMIAAHPSYKMLLHRPQKWRWLANRMNEYFRWRMFRQADAVFVSSDFTRQELTQLFDVDDSRIHTTYRGIDSIYTQPVFRLPTEKTTNFIFYGSLAPIKGIFDVIEALGIASQQGYRDWTLKVAGWGDVDTFHQACQQHNISENVIFLGRLDSDELRQELDWAHIAILPSRAESFGRSIAEAQATGLAVISYDSGSVPGIVENNVTGWLASPEDVNGLANLVLEAINNPSKVYQMGLEGRSRAIERFTWEGVAETILSGLSQNPKPAA